MKPLELQKRLLLAESELNRAQLAQEWETMAEDVRLVTSRAKTIGSAALAAYLLVAGIMSFRRAKSAPAGQKPAWWQTLLKGAGLAATLWSELKPRPKA
jgi:hypothetical protein